MSDEHDRATLGLEACELGEALLLKRRVADRQHLIDQHHVGVDLNCDREGEAHVHAGGVVLQLQVHKRLQLRERDDLIQPLERLAARQAEHDRVDDCVVTRGQIGIEPDAEFDERRQPTVDFNLAGVDAVDAGQALQQRALATPVATDDAEELPRRDLHAHVLDRAELVEAAGAERVQRPLLQRVVLLVGQAEGFAHMTQGHRWRRAHVPPQRWSGRSLIADRRGHQRGR